MLILLDMRLRSMKGDAFSVEQVCECLPCTYSSLAPGLRLRGILFRASRGDGGPAKSNSALVIVLASVL